LFKKKLKKKKLLFPSAACRESKNTWYTVESKTVLEKKGRHYFQSYSSGNNNLTFLVKYFYSPQVSVTLLLG